MNKASTAIHLRFDIKHPARLPEYYKERLLAASHHLISADGVVNHYMLRNIAARKRIVKRPFPVWLR